MQNNSKIKDIPLLVLAIIFSVALMFAFIQLPILINSLIEQKFGFPGFDQGAGETSAFKAELFINALYLRWIGYTSLILICLFILLGFITKKSSWAWAGAIIMFLPVFSQFALSMFFLSGLGVLRAGWLPFIESGLPILELGKVIYVPYWVLLWFFNLFNWYAKDAISWFFMTTGSFLFAWGVFVWFKSRFTNKGVATQWIYKISRHPQYLGWILWSYGLMIYSSTLNNMKKSWGDSTSFPWLIATMIIIAICMIEELAMSKKYGKEYNEYRSITPFIFPLPKFIKYIITIPIRLISKSEFPANKKQIACITLTYTIIFMLISTIWINFNNKPVTHNNNVSNSQADLDSLSNLIEVTFERRKLSRHFDVLGMYGNDATKLLIYYLQAPNPVIREFASNQLGSIKDTSAVEPLLIALKDQNWRVRNSAVIALSEIGDIKAIQPILNIMISSPPNEKYRYYDILAELRYPELWPYLVNDFDNDDWYIRYRVLLCMAQINPSKATQYIIKALQDKNVRVKREAVSILLQLKPAAAIKPLEEILEDEDFEVRFYAKQAINLINKKNKKN